MDRLFAFQHTITLFVMFDRYIYYNILVSCRSVLICSQLTFQHVYDEPIKSLSISYMDDPQQLPTHKGQAMWPQVVCCRLYIMSFIPGTRVWICLIVKFYCKHNVNTPSEYGQKKKFWNKASINSRFTSSVRRVTWDEKKSWSGRVYRLQVGLSLWF